MTHLSEAVERLTTAQQLAMFGCDLVDLLRREGTHSGVWFAPRLLQAADVIERLFLTALPTRDEALEEARTKMRMMTLTSAERLLRGPPTQETNPHVR